LWFRFVTERIEKNGKVDWREGGDRKRVHFCDRDRAKEFLRLKEDVLERRRVGLGYVQEKTIEQFEKLFMENYPKQAQLAPYTVSSYHYALSSCIVPWFTKRLTDRGQVVPLMSLVRPDDVIAFIDEHLKFRSSKTVQNLHGVLSRFFQKALDNKVVLENPVSLVTRPKHIPIQSRTTVDDSDSDATLALADEITRRAIIVMAGTGCRLGELLALRRENFDLKRHVVHVLSNVEHPTKNYQSRTTPISDVVEGLVAGIPTGEKIIPISRGGLQKKFLRIQGKGCSRKWMLHELRHTYISKMLEAGVDKARVMSWVGQKTSKATDIYTHVMKRDVEAFRNLVSIGGEYIGKPAEVIELSKFRSPDGHQNFDHQEKPLITTSYQGLAAREQGFEPR